MLFCDKHDIGNFAGSALNPERQADAFASDLILPNFLLTPRLQKIKKPTLAAARELSDEFRIKIATAFLSSSEGVQPRLQRPRKGRALIRKGGRKLHPTLLPRRREERSLHSWP
jgi:Zn-dependent peptidase ImmA (M78 family)